MIAYEHAGDIYTYDPATHTSALLVGSPDAGAPMRMAVGRPVRSGDQ